MSKNTSEINKSVAGDFVMEGNMSSDPVAEIVARENELVAIKNRTQFLVRPRVLLDFCDMASYQNFDLFETQLLGEAYAEMLDRVAPEFIGHAAIHGLRVDACGDVGFSSLFETYDGYMRETRERISLMFRISPAAKEVMAASIVSRCMIAADNSFSIQPN